MAIFPATAHIKILPTEICRTADALSPETFVNIFYRIIKRDEGHILLYNYDNTGWLSVEMSPIDKHIVIESEL